MNVPWQIFSLIAFVAMSVFVVLSKPILVYFRDKEIPVNRYLLIVFAWLSLGCAIIVGIQFVQNPSQFNQLFVNPNIGWIILLMIVAGVFSAIGNYLDSMAKANCPNVGLAESIKDANTLIILAFSFLTTPLFYGHKMVIFWPAIVGILLIPVGLGFLMNKSQGEGKSVWRIQAISAMLCFAGMIMIIQVVQYLGLTNPFIILLAISLVVVSVYYRRTRAEENQEKVKEALPLYVWLMLVLAVSASLVANVSHYQALNMAKTFGAGGFAQAIFNSQTALSFILSIAISRLFPRFISKEDGGSFTWNGAFGITLVLAGMVLIIFFTQK